MKVKYSEQFAKSIIEKYINVDSIKHIGSGNHSDAFVVNDNLVIKLPKHKKASDCLIDEMKVLKGLDNRLSVNIPNVEFYGTFVNEGQNFVFFASKKLNGSKLSRQKFISLPKKILNKNAEIIANFLVELHSQKHIIQIKRKDLCLLHGDFSLNHCLFDENNLICSVLDFGDTRIGKAKSDFVYLLDAEDDEEFGVEFGQKVLDFYNKRIKEIRYEDNI